MRIDQLPVASSATNLNTIPLNVGGVTEQISVGNLSNAIRDDVYGAPLTASTSAGMTDQTRVYVYTGTTGGGYTNGHWYYYNGSAWTDGGVYNSTAVTTDTTLTLSGVPADAKATGAIKNAVDVMSMEPSITWTIGSTINSNGTINDGTATTGAMSNEIMVDGGDILLRNTPATDANNVTLIVHLCQYSDGVFQSRSSMVYNTPVALASTTDSVRFNFSRASSTGISMTASDISTYFDVAFYRKTLAYVDYEAMAAVENHFDNVGPLINVAESYFNVAYSASDNIIYHSETGLFSDDVLYDGQKSIVCSMLVEACLYAIKYGNSRYVQNTNERSLWGYVTDGTGNYPSSGFVDDYMISSNLAKYCNAHGWLHEYKSDHPQEIMPGDILFFTTSGQSTLDGIYHCGICLRAYKSRYMLIEATNGVYTRLIDNASTAIGCKDYAYTNTRNLTHFARIPVYPAVYKSKLIYSDDSIYSGSYNATSKLVLTKKFAVAKEQGFYTIVFADTGTSEAGYVKVTYSNGSTANYSAQKVGGVNNIAFYAEMPFTQIDFRVSPSIISSSAQAATYDVTGIKVYRGYHPLDA